jgi:L-lactate dehydrogenase
MKITVFGVGMVGATYAYRLLISGLVDEIALVDSDLLRAEAEAAELNHAKIMENQAKIYSGGMEISQGSDLIVFSAGSGRLDERRGRLGLFEDNLSLVAQTVPELARLSPNAKFLVVTNPVDPLAYAVYKYSGFKPGRVFSSGTLLDTGRFKFYLSQFLGVEIPEIRGWVVGEHGDSQVILWGGVRVKGLPLKEYLRSRNISLTEQTKWQIEEQTRTAAYQIVSGKKATYYAIASSLSFLTAEILNPSQTEFICGTIRKENGRQIVVSLPLKLVPGGVIYASHELSLEENEKLNQSKNILADYCSRVDETWSSQR